jgi:Fe-S-cluster-containing hydrogenase component 2
VKIMKVLKINPDKCTGCMNCAIACSLVKSNECNPHRGAIRVERNEFERYEIPVVCIHCDDPVCAINCPQNAYDEKDGVMEHQPERCILCGMCALLCPHLGINFTGDELIKCDLCGGSPVCIKFCSTGAIEFVEAESVIAEARDRHVTRTLDSKRIKQNSA